DFARDQRVLHALGAHGDAIADGDGAEGLRHGLRLAHGGDGALGQIVETGVAGRDGAVAVGNADDRLVEVLVAKPDGAKHGAVGSALKSLGYGAAAKIVAHIKGFTSLAPYRNRGPPPRYFVPRVRNRLILEQFHATLAVTESPKSAQLFEFKGVPR